MYPRLNQGERVSPLVHSQHKLDSVVVEHRAIEKYTASMASSNKKDKRNLSESDSENEAADFPRFIVIESLEEAYRAKFSSFLIEKVISTRAIQKSVKKTRNGNLLVELDSRGQAESISKMKTFQTKYRAYPQEKLFQRSYLE